MAVFLLIPGAGGEPWFFHRVVASLGELGHEAIAVDLPADDESLDWPDYVDVALKALGSVENPVVVAQSMGAFTGALVAAEIPVAHLVLLNPMIPAPGETAGEWWEAVGQEQARRDIGLEGFDMERDFLHDIPAFLREELLAGGRPQSDRSFAAPYPLREWPAVPTTVVVGREDRLFPLALQQRVARDRLGLGVVEVPGGHLNSLSYPTEVAAALAAVV
jgi:pimeloyl-ACP methyl ester carboxylesterase